MKKIVLNILIGILFIGNTIAQQNSLYSTPFLYLNDGIYSGNMIAYGIDLNYSRKVLKNLRIGAGFGKGSFSGKNSFAFEIQGNEKGYLPLTRWNIGFEYSIIKTDHLLISTGTEFLFSKFPIVSSIYRGSSGEIIFRQVSMTNSQNYLLHLKMENNLGSNTFWTTQFSYQPYFINANEVLMAKTGIGIRF
jgi:hypothetical protein